MEWKEGREKKRKITLCVHCVATAKICESNLKDELAIKNRVLYMKIKNNFLLQT
jgi:hypothetical protein